MPPLSTSGFFLSSLGSALGGWYQLKVGSELVSPQGLFLSALLRGLSVVGFKGRKGTGQPLALRYLGLLLRMDPQLNWFKVVAGNKPLLQRSIVEPESGNKDADVSSSAGHPETWGGVGGQVKEGAAGLHIRQQMLLLKKLCHVLPGSCAINPPTPHPLNTCPLNMTVAQLSLPFFKTKTMFPGMTCSSSGVSGTNPNNTRWASPSRALRDEGGEKRRGRHKI